MIPRDPYLSLSPHHWHLWRQCQHSWWWWQWRFSTWGMWDTLGSFCFWHFTNSYPLSPRTLSWQQHLTPSDPETAQDLTSTARLTGSCNKCSLTVVLHASSPKCFKHTDPQKEITKRGFRAAVLWKVFLLLLTQQYYKFSNKDAGDITSNSTSTCVCVCVCCVVYVVCQTLYQALLKVMVALQVQLSALL